MPRRTKTRSARSVLAWLTALGLALALCVQALAAEPKPRVNTGGITHVHGGSGQLNGVVNPNGVETSYYFQYGPTAAFGQQTKPVAVGAGTQPVKVGQIVSGLIVGDHYRIVATFINKAGVLTPVPGNEKTYKAGKESKLRFNVEKGKEAELTATYGEPFEFSAGLAGLGNANHSVSLQGTPYPFTGAFSQLSGPILTGRTGSFTFKIARVYSSMELRVVANDTRPLYSSVVTLHVTPHIVLHVRSAGKTGLYRLYGTVSPARTGAALVIQQLLPQKAGSKRSGPKPHSVATTLLKRATSKLSRFSVIVSLTGTYHYRAYVRLPKGAIDSGHGSDVLIKAPKTSAKHKKK